MTTSALNARKLGVAARGSARAAGVVQRARLSVVPRAQVRSPRVPFVAMVTVLLLGGVVGLLLFNTSMQQASFAATQLQEQSTALDARQQTLELELEALRDPQHVAEVANKLGMVPAGAPLFLDLSKQQVIGDRAASAGSGLRVAPYPPPRPGKFSVPPKVVQVPAQPGAQPNAANPNQNPNQSQANPQRKPDTPRATR